jgi:hypothetical protein
MSCIGIHIHVDAHPPFLTDLLLTRSSSVYPYRTRPVPIIRCPITNTALPNRCNNTRQHSSQTRPKHTTVLPSSILAVSPPPTRCPTLSLLTYSARACPLLAQRPRARSGRRLHQTLPQAPCHAKSSGILPKLHHSLHRGLLNSLLDAASPLS